MASVGAKIRAKREAAKRRAQAGRKPKQGVARHPSGKIIQPANDEREADAVKTAVQARQRVFGISAALAATQEAGSALGRLLEADRAFAPGNQAQHFREAGEYFLERHRANQAAIDAQRLLTNTDYTRGRGRTLLDGTEHAYVTWCDRSRARWAELRRAILTCGDPFAMSALEQVILEDKEPMSDGVKGSLRCGLNAVHRVRVHEQG